MADEAEPRNFPSHASDLGGSCVGAAIVDIAGVMWLRRRYKSGLLVREE